MTGYGKARSVCRRKRNSGVLNSSENFGQSRLWMQIINSLSHTDLMCFPLSFCLQNIYKVKCISILKQGGSCSEDCVFCWHNLTETRLIIPIDVGSENQGTPKLGWMSGIVTVFLQYRKHTYFHSQTAGVSCWGIWESSLYSAFQLPR